MSAPWLRVVVVDDHSLFAESLAIALRGREVEACTVVPDSASATYAQLERAVVKTQPDLVLLDLDLGIPGDAMPLLSGLAESGISVVVVTGTADRVRQGEALANGARAVIEKSAPFSDILQTVERVHNGLPVMTRAKRDVLLAAYRDSTESTRELRRRFATMTRREAEVLGLLMAGRQVSEIARCRFVSESTVRTQVKSVLGKLQVRSQLSAVGLAHKIGWCPPTGAEPGDTDARSGDTPGPKSSSHLAAAG